MASQDGRGRRTGNGLSTERPGQWHSVAQTGHNGCWRWCPTTSNRNGPGRLLVSDHGSSRPPPESRLHRPWLSDFCSAVVGSSPVLRPNEPTRRHRKGRGDGPRQWHRDLPGSILMESAPAPHLGRMPELPFDGQFAPGTVIFLSLPASPCSSAWKLVFTPSHGLGNCALLVARKHGPAMALPGRFIYKPQNVVYPACPGICGSLESGEHG